METQTKNNYFAGYRAFERGDYVEAIDLATQVLATAKSHAYWYWGALGLRCWAANFGENKALVKRDAQALISSESGPETRWFQRVAHLNLGLLYRRSQISTLTQTHFLRAHESYAAYTIQPSQPASWEYVRRFFAGVALWAADNSTEQLKTLCDDITSADTLEDEIACLGRALRLYLLHAEGKPVREAASHAVQDGVSRTFLALLLI